MIKLFHWLSTMSFLQSASTKEVLEEELELLSKERLRAVAKYHRAAIEVEYHANLIAQYQYELDTLKEPNDQTQETKASNN